MKKAGDLEREKQGSPAIERCKNHLSGSQKSIHLLGGIFFAPAWQEPEPREGGEDRAPAGKRSGPEGVRENHGASRVYETHIGTGCP